MGHSTLVSFRVNMDKIINLGIPHVAEQIFKQCGLEDLLQFQKVSETWQILTEDFILFHKWKGKVHWACTVGKSDVMKLLVKRPDVEQVDFNAIDDHGKTPLILACQYGHHDIVKLLLANCKQIDVNAQDNHGKTAFIWACSYGFEDIVKTFLDYSLTNQFDLNARDFNGQTALTIAFESRRKDIVKIMLEHPCNRQIDFDARSKFGRTAFMWACSHEYHEDIVKLFLKQAENIQIDLNAKDQLGQTAFMSACTIECEDENNDYRITKLLLDHAEKLNIDVNARDNYGKTALLQVCQGENRNVIPFVQFLIQFEDIEIPAEKPHLLRQAFYKSKA